MRRLLRSYLFAPGDNESLLAKALAASADAVVFDLEDAVSADRKEFARQVVAGAIKRNPHTSTPIYVRINPVGSDFWLEDAASVVGRGLSGIRLAKAESAEQIAALDDHLSRLEARTGIDAESIAIVPTIESARGVMAATEIARRPRVEALCFGMTDFLADIHARPDDAFTASLFALSSLVIASKASGILPPIASVHTQLNDREGLLASTERYRIIGFLGRSCIHPSQIEVINNVFTPSAQEVAQAEALLAVFENSAALQRGASVSNQGQFIDEAVVKRARGIISLARNCKSSVGKGC